MNPVSTSVAAELNPLRGHVMAINPVTITLATVSTPLVRIEAGETSAHYRSADEVYDFHVKHQYAKRRRREVRLDHNKIAADPLTSENQRFSASAFLVIDEPLNGYTDAELKTLVTDLLTYLTASSGAKIAEVLTGDF
jgi:hypothetical protein